jgi:hypothetical protein
LRSGANSLAHTNANSDADVNPIGDTNGDTYSDANSLADRYAQSNSEASSDSASSPHALARGWNSVCGNSRKKLVSSRGSANTFYLRARLAKGGSSLPKMPVQL